jgi:hypothetical protein
MHHGAAVQQAMYLMRETLRGVLIGREVLGVTSLPEEGDNRRSDLYAGGVQHVDICVDRSLRIWSQVYAICLAGPSEPRHRVLRHSTSLSIFADSPLHLNITAGRLRSSE